MKNLLCSTNENLRRAAALIQNGGVVAFPTETVYGLGADVFNLRAVARIFEIKNRPSFDPLIVHIADFNDMKKLCSSINASAKKLMKKFWPGPLTLVLPKHKTVPDIVTAGLPTVAVRMPSHSVALRLIQLAETPIAAPSANPFGFLSPTTAMHVAEQLGDKVDLILDSGKCSVGIESTILDLSGDMPVLLRPGGIPLEVIEKAMGQTVLKGSQSLPKPMSPGQLPCHYSPSTPIKILNGEQSKQIGKVGLLALKVPRNEAFFKAVEVLSISGDLKEAAANLFSCLHRLDGAKLDMIYAEPVPEVGLGRAIMDRLRRASAPKGDGSL
ncbi:MAG: L-threonylcarbamoyladenylate synthase [Candidatus Omnitrophota bacterium]